MIEPITLGCRKIAECEAPPQSSFESWEASTSEVINLFITARFKAEVLPECLEGESAEVNAIYKYLKGLNE